MLPSKKGVNYLFKIIRQSTPLWFRRITDDQFKAEKFVSLKKAFERQEDIP
jgi:hypothetical protein